MAGKTSFLKLTVNYSTAEPKFSSFLTILNYIVLVTTVHLQFKDPNPVLCFCFWIHLFFVILMWSHPQSTGVILLNNKKSYHVLIAYSMQTHFSLLHKLQFYPLLTRTVIISVSCLGTLKHREVT